MNLVLSSKSITMSSREIAELVEQRHDNVKRTIETLGVKAVITLPQIEEVQNLGNGPKTIGVYQLGKRDSLIVVAQLCPEFTAKIVDRWQELEAQLAPSLPRSFAEALRLAADEAERAELAERQRDEAVATKALIGDKREATAMNTASQAVKKAQKLEIELDRAKEYATLKRMQMIHHGQPFNWRMLKAASIEMGIPAIEIFDANYGTVKAYHADVWREVYALDIEQGRAAA